MKKKKKTISIRIKFYKRIELVIGCPSYGHRERESLCEEPERMVDLLWSILLAHTVKN